MRKWWQRIFGHEKMVEHTTRPFEVLDEYERAKEAIGAELNEPGVFEIHQDRKRRNLTVSNTETWNLNTTVINESIKRMQDLLTTPNLSQATIDEINTNLQELLRMQRTPRLEKQQVFQD